jgi:hypothetical protein
MQEMALTLQTDYRADPNGWQQRDVLKMPRIQGRVGIY